MFVVGYPVADNQGARQKALYIVKHCFLMMTITWEMKTTTIIISRIIRMEKRIFFMEYRLQLRNITYDQIGLGTYHEFNHGLQCGMT